MLLLAADFHIEGDRGTAFGMLQMTSLLGGAFGALYATNMGGLLRLQAISQRYLPVIG